MSHLEHYGTPRHSGRYPWGSGKNPQRSRNWLQRAEELEKQGLTQKQVAEAFNMSTGEYRNRKSIHKSNVQMEDIRKCIRLRDTGMSLQAISKETGLPESTVRTYLNPTRANRIDRTHKVANELKDLLKEKPYLDVGENVNRQLGISEEQLGKALMVLKDEGYNVHTLRLNQTDNPNQKTTYMVLTDGDVTRKDVFDNRDKITSPDGLYFTDGGDEVHKREPVPSIDSKRIQVRYTEDGGSEMDGVIQIRPGVEDISLGDRKYAQVRIAVDGTHYLKGMAVYSNDIPDGVDIVFNTNKHEGTPALGEKNNTVLKLMDNDPANPFGANFRQWKYVDADGKEHVSPINIVNDDEDWDKWKKSLSSQFLSKQYPQLAKRQLTLDYQGRENELNDILAIPNPTVRRELLAKFADECDAAAVHLKGAALPRQSSCAIVPVPSMKDNEVYAPGYSQGEEVVLVRFPHAGIFEMPRLRVNNNVPEAIETLGEHPAHAIGINSTVANQLSGADFDGDTVLVIPTKGQNIRTKPPLEKLKDFDPKELYRKGPDDIETGKDGFNKQMQMGSVSNLITDMTIKNADEDEITRAVKHSMVVIDAEKHNLDWKQSAIDNGIAELKAKYQPDGGAATLISRRKQTYDDIPERTEVYSTYQIKDDPEKLKAWDEGKHLYLDTGRTYLDKKGNVVTATHKHGEGPYKILEEEDAHTLSSGYRIENLYADYANDCKALGDKARAELRKTGTLKQNKEAKDTYKEEVESLKAKLDMAEKDRVYERQAHVISSVKVQAKIDANPELKDKDHKDKLKKIRAKELAAAREQVHRGEKRYRIHMTPKEWEAIQAGAISDNMLSLILRSSDMSEVRQLAAPRKTTGMSSSAKTLARNLLRAGYPQSVVAERVGVSVSTLSKEFKNFNELGGE